MSKLLLLFCFLPLLGQSQIYFNKLYDSNNSADAGSNVLETDSCYIITGANVTQAGRQEFAIIITDKKGNVKFNKSHSYGWTKAVRYGQTILLKNGNIADYRTLQEYDSGQQDYRTWSVLSIFDEKGDKLWSKQYKDPNIFWLAGQAMLETTDSGFVLVADKQIAVDNNNPVLIRTDKNGKELFRNEIKTNKIESIYSVVQYKTGGYVFGGGGTSNGSFFRSWVVRTDDSLNLSWEKYGSFQSSHYTKAIVLSDSTIINTTDSVNSGHNWAFKRIVKLDSSGKVIWAKNYEKVQLAAFYAKAVELIDNSLVAYGEHRVGSSALRTLTKLTAKGDTIWMNLYYYDSPDDQNYLRDFIATKDGGFLLGGDVSPRSTSGGQDLWLLKVDSNGCSTPSCTSRVYDIRLGIDYRQEANTNFKVFPNPAVNHLNIEQLGSSESNLYWNYKLLNVDGKEVESGKFQKEKTLNTNNLPVGVYLLKLENGPIQKVYRVVKE